MILAKILISSAVFLPAQMWKHSDDCGHLTKSPFSGFWRSVACQLASLSRCLCFCCLNTKLVKNRPNQLRVSSTLKQKMASFQNLMDAEESQLCHLMPRQDSGSGDCFGTGDNLSGEAATLPQD